MLIGTISTDTYVVEFIFHEEDLVADCAKLAIKEENRYLVFYELGKPLMLMTEEELFVGVETFCTDVRPGFSSYAERLNFGIPRVLLIDRKKPISDMMN